MHAPKKEEIPLVNSSEKAQDMDLNTSFPVMNSPQQIPSSYDHAAVEKRWESHWDTAGVYRWDPSRGREDTYVIDTPPPTVSGSLHVGHVFSYTHTDVLARYHRMQGKTVLYPMGWDDNGLPTERRVQNMFGISCNPNLPYDASWQPGEDVVHDKKGKQELREVSRPNFIEACNKVTHADEAAFCALWKHLGLSVDWLQEYNTIGTTARAMSQRSFLDLVAKKEVYQVDAPTVWDTTFRTAVAQAELEDREAKGHFHDLRFMVKGGSCFTISTTRPELLAACIAIVAHPEDVRYQGLFGKYAVTPLFGAQVPILASKHADPEKGTGIMMVCTFGDTADLAWWKGSGLPMRSIIGRDGRLLPIRFGTENFPSVDPDRANRAYSQLAGKSITQAKGEIRRLLAEPSSGFDSEVPALMGVPRPITHSVKFYEKGDSPVEYVSSRQWYIRLTHHKDALLALGDQLSWHPEHMKSRYEHWVRELNYDWCVSRQRFFGVPFPVWYPLDEANQPDYSRPLYARPEDLPVDPLSQPAPGYREDQRNVPGGFIGDPDVMDTWATSSVTPQIISAWGLDQGRHSKVFPMDVRPQSHEIIRTWAFYTIVKAYLHEGTLPWKDIAISGWILDPDRKKMSKSKGNVVTPGHLLEKYSSDAVRYWAAKARLGIDTTFDEKVFEIGRKISVKLYNSSRFVLLLSEKQSLLGTDLSTPKDTHPLDRAWLSKLGAVIKNAKASFEEFDHAGALAEIEAAFWEFCDYYIELVKTRAYQGTEAEQGSAISSLKVSLDAFLKLFAPYMPYVTEEVWSYCPWRPAESNSIHTEVWPDPAAWQETGSGTAYQFARSLIDEVRRVKGEAKKGMKWPVELLLVAGTAEDIEAVKTISDDICNTAKVVARGLSFRVDNTAAAGKIMVTVKLAENVGIPNSVE